VLCDCESPLNASFCLREREECFGKSCHADDDRKREFRKGEKKAGNAHFIAQVLVRIDEIRRQVVVAFRVLVQRPDAFFIASLFQINTAMKATDVNGKVLKWTLLTPEGESG